MDIGIEKPAIQVEPVEDPFEAKPEREPPAPEHEPTKEPAEPVPTKGG